jgi:molecular chaperone GrpE
MNNTEELPNDNIEEIVLPNDELAENATEEILEEQEVVEEISETEKLQNELAELKDKYLRLYADFDNFRKRTAKEKLEMFQSASEKVLVDLLPVVDDYERAVANSKEGEISEGIALVFNKLNSVFSAKGLKVIEAKGEVFNADLHDCIAQFPVQEEDAKGKVFDVVEKGYYLNEKVIRFAKVIVGS